MLIFLESQTPYLKYTKISVKNVKFNCSHHKTSRKLHYLLFTEYYLQRLTVLRIHLLFILKCLK